MDQNVNDSKSHIRDSFCKDIISVSGIQLFHICPYVSVSLKANKNQLKRSLVLQYSFAEKTSLVLRTSSHLKLKIIYSRNTAKNLSHLTNFPANIFLFVVRKNICDASFLDTQELHSWSTLRANVCILLNIPVRKVLFLRRSKILSGLEGQNDFFKGGSLFEPRKMFYNFSF